MIGERHSKWKGGRRKASNGYIIIWSPNHPGAIQIGNSKYMLEHRLIMEKKIGRYLRPKEVVHHINGIRDDNRLENLELTTSSNNIARSNSTREVTDSYRKKHSQKASQIPRDKNGRFIK
jgi:hypothetical protein